VPGLGKSALFRQDHPRRSSGIGFVPSNPTNPRIGFVPSKPPSTPIREIGFVPSNPFPATITSKWLRSVNHDIPLTTRNLSALICTANNQILVRSRRIFVKLLWEVGVSPVARATVKSGLTLSRRSIQLIATDGRRVSSTVSALDPYSSGCRSLFRKPLIVNSPPLIAASKVNNQVERAAREGYRGVPSHRSLKDEMRRAFLIDEHEHLIPRSVGRLYDSDVGAERTGSHDGIERLSRLRAQLEQAVQEGGADFQFASRLSSRKMFASSVKAFRRIWSGRAVAMSSLWSSMSSLPSSSPPPSFRPHISARGG
jgi:hypothetical protein